MLNTRKGSCAICDNSLIRVFIVRLQNDLILRNISTKRESSDRPAQMLGLIRQLFAYGIMSIFQGCASIMIYGLRLAEKWDLNTLCIQECPDQITPRSRLTCIKLGFRRNPLEEKKRKTL